MLKASSIAASIEIVLISIFLMYIMANNGPGGGSGLFILFLPIVWIVAFLRISAVLALINLKEASRKEVISSGAIFGALSGFLIAALLGEKSFQLLWLTLITTVSTVLACFIASNNASP